MAVGLQTGYQQSQPVSVKTAASKVRFGSGSEYDKEIESRKKNVNEAKQMIDENEVGALNGVLKLVLAAAVAALTVATFKKTYQVATSQGKELIQKTNKSEANQKFKANMKKIASSISEDFTKFKSKVDKKAETSKIFKGISFCLDKLGQGAKAVKKVVTDISAKFTKSSDKINKGVENTLAVTTGGFAGVETIQETDK